MWVACPKLTRGACGWHAQSWWCCWLRCMSYCMQLWSKCGRDHPAGHDRQPGHCVRGRRCVARTLEGVEGGGDSARRAAALARKMGRGVLFTEEARRVFTPWGRFLTGRVCGWAGHCRGSGEAGGPRMSQERQKNICWGVDLCCDRASLSRMAPQHFQLVSN